MARFVAIDLGRHAVKGTVLEGSGRSAAVVGHFSEPVGDEGDAPDNPLGPRLAALDRLLQSHHEWQAPTTVLGLAWAADDATVRVIHLPLTDRAQVEQALPFTVEELVPFDLDDMVFAWRTLPTRSGTRALVCLTRLDRLRPALDALHQRDVDPRQVVLDGEGLGALAGQSGALAIVDVGHASTTVSVVAEGQVVSSRAIDVAGRRFTRAIADALGVPFAEAEALKHGAWPADEEPTESGLDGARGLAGLPPQAQAAVDAVFGLLLAEVRTTLIDAEDTQGVDIQRVLLTGGGARLEPLADYLGRDLGLPVERVVDRDGAEVPGEHAAALGLARLLAEGGRAIDLRVGPLAYKGGVNVLRAVVTYGAAGVAFFLLASLVVFAVQFKGLMDQQNEVDARIRSIVLGAFPDTNAELLANSGDAALLMQGLVENEERRADKIAGSSRVPPTIDLLYKLTTAFPPHPQVTVDVGDLTIRRGAITFTAETDGYESAAAVESALQAVPEFEAATKGEERRRGTNVEFSMTIPLVAEDPRGAQGGG